MPTNIYKFEQGRLLVQEVRAVESNYLASGIPVRIGQIRCIEKVLSVDTDYSQYGLITPLEEVTISGSEIFVVMRRGDNTTPTVSGWITSGPGPYGQLHPLRLVLSGRILSGPMVSSAPVQLAISLGSGSPAYGLLSGLTSGLASMGPLVSGAVISGRITVKANVIGY